MKMAQTVSGAARELRDITLKAVIKVLLTESKHRAQNSVEAIARMHTRSAGYSSAGRILKEMNASQEVVDFAIEICLLRIRKGHPALDGGDALSAACGYLAYGASEDVKNKVIMEVARQGMHGWIEGLTRKHLSRDLTTEEARVLLRVCLENRLANTTTGVAEHLLMIARRCLPEGEVKKIEEQIRESKGEFDSHLD